MPASCLTTINGRILVLVIGALASRAAPAQDAAPEATSEPALTVRVIAIGGIAPRRWTLSAKEAGMDKFEASLRSGGGGTSEGESSSPGDDVGPGGTLPPRNSGQQPFMMPEDPRDYPPRPLYVGTDPEFRRRYLWLTPGSLGPRFALPRTASLGLFRDDVPNEGEAPPPFRRVGIGEGTTHLTLLLAKAAGDDGWFNPHIFPIDTSPRAIPVGSAFLLNMSGSTLRCATHSQTHDLESSQKLILPSDQVVGGRLRFDLKAVDEAGRELPIARSQRRIADDSRLILIVYRDEYARTPLDSFKLLVYSEDGASVELPQPVKESTSS